jgi:hypothetical protein
MYKSWLKYMIIRYKSDIYDNKLTFELSTVILIPRYSWLIIYDFTSRSRIFHLYGDVTIAGEGLKI